MTQQSKKRFGGSQTQREYSTHDKRLTDVLYPALCDERSVLNRDK